MEQPTLSIRSILLLIGATLAGGALLVMQAPAWAELPEAAAAEVGDAPQPGGGEPSPATGAGPVEFRIDEDIIFPPAAPDGIVGIDVPVIVSEPAAVYKTAPATEATEGIYATDVPAPTHGAPNGHTFPADDWVQIGPSREANWGAEISIGTEPPTPAAPPLSSSFDSLNFDDNSSFTGGWYYIPPDPHGAAGIGHVVNVVNVGLRFHTKTGTPTFSAGLASFFSSLGPLTDTFDPKVLYDQFADRFVIVTLERTDTFFGDPADTSRIFVAVSDDGDPNGIWYQTAINSSVRIGTTPSWADYPGLAVDEEAVYITANMFGFFSSGAPFTGVRLWVINKGLGSGGLYDGGGATAGLFDPYAVAGIPATTQPAHVYGAAPTTPNVGTWLVSFSGLTGGGSELLQFVRIDNPVGTPTFTQQLLNIGNIDPNVTALPDAPQAGTTELVEVNDRRALDAVWRDDNSLWTVATIEPVSGADAGETTAHWWQLDTTTLASISLVQQGDVGGNSIAADTYTFFPSIAVSSANDVAIGFAASAATIFPSSAYTTRLASDPPGTTTSATLLRPGLDFYIRTFDRPPCSFPPARNRWGDYSAAVLDPVDQCFWIYNEHAGTRGTGTTGGCNGRPAIEDGRWVTAWGRACMCSETFSLTTGEWKQISLPCDPGAADTVADVFGDDLSGTYNVNWVVFERDATNEVYVKKALTDPLVIGRSYWIKTNLAAQSVTAEGIDNVVVDVPLVSDTTDGAGCASSAGRCNKVGHPHKFDVCWADAEVIDGASTLSLSAADPGGACQGANAAANGCVMSRIAHKWTGAGYAPFDGQTPGMEGTLVPWDGFWVSAVKSGIELRIPATAGSCGAPAGPVTASAASGTLDPRAGAARSIPSGWFIRLSAESDTLVDDSNVLGQLPDSVNGYDSHDLIELDPFGNDFLTIVFPHPEWGDRAGNYASDYHGFEGKRHEWRFEVQSSDPGAHVLLRWKGPAEKLRRSALVDRETRKRIRPRTDGSYAFTMNGGSRAFRWVVKRSRRISEKGKYGRFEESGRQHEYSK